MTQTGSGWSLDRIVEAVLAELRAALVETLPQLLTALIFFVVAYVAIRAILRLVRPVFEAVYDDLVADLFTTVVAVFLWFGAALALLKLLGMGEIAASLGTATGFVALGVSYALSDMIADTVAGVYLLKDPDFNPGDEVVAADVTGTVQSIELRKTRLTADGGDVVVLANSKVEAEWTKKSSSGSAVGAADPDDERA
ncbi:mechanosensitive ion channel domain-containing protein [Halorussus vallis]|uniref:mechanosensitive ion channel domain-containing protein n=2 Tax=Halorussus TaxID=1070314 RepID=UPI0034A1991A